MSSSLKRQARLRNVSFIKIDACDDGNVRRRKRGQCRSERSLKVNCSAGVFDDNALETQSPSIFSRETHAKICSQTNTYKSFEISVSKIARKSCCRFAVIFEKRR